MLRELVVEGYRSLRSVRLSLGALDVIVGPNGCGKTNLYRSLLLLSEAAKGGLARALAEEGGMPSVVWAGRRLKKKPVRVGIEVAVDDFRYRIALGVPIPSDTLFKLDPEVKEEEVRYTGVPILARKGATAHLRDGDGQNVTFPLTISQRESILSEIRDPKRFPTAAALRDLFSGWRFYHQFRVDQDSPIRRPRTGVFTPVLANDGADLAAALQTIREAGHGDALAAAVRLAFPGSGIVIEGGVEPFALHLASADFPRPFSALELSDGTLKYLCLVAALLSPRPPALLALNEPEASIHEDLLPALARLIVACSERSQVLITTHSRILAVSIEELSGRRPIVLEKEAGETRVVSRG